MIPKPKMRDVAEAAKVSLMTVSYALRNHSSIPVATRERVQQIATELGYVRSPLVGALMTQIRRRNKSDAKPVIAYLSAYADRKSMMSNGFRKACFQGASCRAQSLGFRLELFLPHSRSKRCAKSLSSVLINRNVQAVICGISPVNALPEDVDWASFSACVIGRSRAYPHLHRIDGNYAVMALTAIERLRAMGFTKIGFLSAFFEDERVEGAIGAALIGYNLAVPTRDHIRFATMSRQNWRARPVADWVKRQKLDALIIQSHSVQRFLVNSGIRIPEDLALATLERTEESGLAGIDQQPGELGTAAVDLVTNELYQNRRGIPDVRQTLLLDGHWIDGASAQGHCGVSSSPVS